MYFGLLGKTSKVSTCETPFGLIYGTETVTPIEVMITSHKVQQFDPRAINIKRWTNLDLEDEK